MGIYTNIPLELHVSKTVEYSRKKIIFATNVEAGGMIENLFAQWLEYKKIEVKSLKE